MQTWVSTGRYPEKAAIGLAPSPSHILLGYDPANPLRFHEVRRQRDSICFRPQKFRAMSYPDNPEGIPSSHARRLVESRAIFIGQSEVETLGPMEWISLKDTHNGLGLDSINPERKYDGRAICKASLQTGLG